MNNENSMFKDNWSEKNVHNRVKNNNRVMKNVQSPWC